MRLSRVQNIPIDEVTSLSEAEKVALKDAGFDSAVDFILAPVQALTDQGLPIAKLNVVTQLVSGRIIIRADQLREVYRFPQTISTNSQALDECLSGGVRIGEITDFFGASGSGKTQICFQLSVNSVINRQGEVVFVDPMRSFRPERILEIASGRLDQKTLLNRILVFQPRNVSDQMEISKRIQSLVSDHKINLLVIDNIGGLFSFDLSGERGLIERQFRLAKHLHDLALIALEFDLAVVVTNNVRSRISDGGSVETEYGGRVISDGCHNRAHLTRTNNGWVAALQDNIQERPPAIFHISSAGITD